MCSYAFSFRYTDSSFWPFLFKNGLFAQAHYHHYLIFIITTLPPYYTPNTTSTHSTVAVYRVIEQDVHLYNGLYTCWQPLIISC